MRYVVSYIIIKENNVIKCNDLIKAADSADDILFLADDIIMHDDNAFAVMSSCLHAADKHAIVCGFEIENNKSLIETALKYLPEYSTVSEVNACCALIKRSVIDKLGYLDESFENLQEALLDYYRHINRFGFSSVVSYRALFSYDKKAKTDSNQDALQRPVFQDLHPCVSFLKVLDENYYPKKRILFDCAIMPSMYCGTSEYQKAIFESFYRLFKDKYEIYIYVGREAAEYHKLSETYDNIIYPDTINETTGAFHIGFAPNQLMHVEHQLLMSMRCLKIVHTMHDIMMVRINEHIGVGDRADVELGIRLSDGIVCISNYTKDDFLARYYYVDGINEKRIPVIYNSTAITPPENEHELPFDEYFLIPGNSYKHKAIKEAIKAVSGSAHNFIVIGIDDNEFIEPNIYSYKSGQLDSDFMNYLYANCKAIVIPSLYEGFGLPLIIGFKFGKRVIVNNNPLNKELREHFKQLKIMSVFLTDLKKLQK